MDRRSSWWFSSLFLLCAGSVMAQGVDRELQEKINRAIDAGVAFLKRVQVQGDQTGRPGLVPGMWPFSERVQYHQGMTALAAWALLESGVPPTDPVIERAAKYLREQCIAETNPYNVSPEIIFFDKLGDPNDIPLIEALGLRLMQSQQPDGGWQYEFGEGGAFPIPKEEQDRLRQVIRQRRNDLPRPKLPRSFKQLDPSIQAQIQQLPNPAPVKIAAGGTDNSSAQFAMIALWVAQRYGLPAQPYLARTATRLLFTQFPDGSWTYRPISPEMLQFAPPQMIEQMGKQLKKSPAMTCVGLLGLFVGVINDPKSRDNPHLKKQLIEWAPVQKGFKYLGHLMRTMQQPDPQHYYFLWSMERVGVAYDIKLIDGIDWYRWGAEWLVQNQSPDGSWQGGPAGESSPFSNTAFALLFLKRVNVFKDDPTLPPALLTTIPKEQPKAKPKEKARPIDLPPLIIPKEELKKKKSSNSKSSASQQSSRLFLHKPAATVPVVVLEQPSLYERRIPLLATPALARRYQCLPRT